MEEAQASESTVVLKERGEVLPQDDEEESAPAHRDKRRADIELISYATAQTLRKQRGETLPRSGRDQLLPADAKALETDSETEEDPPASSAKAPSETPWDRRVRKREAKEPARSSEESRCPAVLHGMASIRGVPRDILSSLPKELYFDWQEGAGGGFTGTRLEFLARGGDKLVFEAEDMLLKLSTVTQYPEVRYSKLLPKLTARTFWQERVQIKLHGDLGEVVHSHDMFISCQDKVLLASELLGARGETFAFHFLAYVGCLLTYVTSLGITAQDTGVSNLGVRLSTASAACPEAVFFDTLSWKQGSRPSSKWVGWCDCARRFCPLQSSWLQEASAKAASDPAGTFARLLTECQAYSFRLKAQGVLEDGVLAKAVLPK